MNCIYFGSWILLDAVDILQSFRVVFHLRELQTWVDRSI